MHVSIKQFIALAFSAISSIATACPDLGEDLSFPGASFEKGIKIHVDRRQMIDGKMFSHVIDIDGHKVWFDGGWKMKTGGETSDVEGNVSLKKFKGGPVLGLLVVKDGKLLIQSVKDGEYDPSGVSAILELKTEVNHGSMGPGAGNYGPSGFMTLEVKAEKRAKTIGQYSSSLNPNGPVPKSALVAETETKTLVLGGGKSHVSNGCGQRIETKLSDGNNIAPPAIGF